MYVVFVKGTAERILIGSRIWRLRTYWKRSIPKQLQLEVPDILLFGYRVRVWIWVYSHHRRPRGGEFSFATERARGHIALRLTLWISDRRQATARPPTKGFGRLAEDKSGGGHTQTEAHQVYSEQSQWEVTGGVDALLAQCPSQHWQRNGSRGSRRAKVTSPRRKPLSDRRELPNQRNWNPPNKCCSHWASRKWLQRQANRVALSWAFQLRSFELWPSICSSPPYRILHLLRSFTHCFHPASIS